MDTTPRLQLPYIAPQQAQKQVTYNQAMRALDQLVQPAVKSRTIATPPGSPAEGDTYVVGPAPTGAWAGHEGKLASFLDGAWSFRTPVAGWQLYVEDSAEIVIHKAGAWVSFVTNGGSAVAKLGINTDADLINRLAVASEGSLLTHAGAGHRLTLNKAAPADTGSLLFQTAFSGRAEFGLAGDDDFHVKVSPNGSTWFEALTVARASGAVTLPQGQLAFPATQNPSADPNTLDDYEEGVWTVTPTSTSGSFASVSAGGSYVKIGKQVTINVIITLTNVGTASGNLIFNLPFTAGSTGNSQIGACRENAVTGKMGQASIANGASTAFIQDYTGGTGAAVITNGYVWHVSCTYVAAS